MSVKVIGKTKKHALKRRHNRLRKKISGTAERPRLLVVRSLRHTNAMLINDDNSTTLGHASTLKLTSGTKTEQAAEVGKNIAKIAKDKGIETVVFDRGGNKYHGRVAAVAEAAREEGLKF